MDSAAAAFIDRTLRAEASEWRTWANGDASVGGLRRLAAIVLLQRQAGSLTANDLTRIEGFLRDARVPDLIEPLAVDVLRPLLACLTGTEADRARRIVERWATADAEGLRAAAALL